MDENFNFKMKEILKSKQIIKISDDIIFKWHAAGEMISDIKEALDIFAGAGNNDIEARVEALSIINTTLWHEEDRARDAKADFATIAEVKRRIDRINAARVNKVEEIDSIIYNEFNFNYKAPLNTETPGSVIDRLTILCLKKYHMKLEAERTDASMEHRKRCGENFSAVDQQMDDLSAAYDNFIKEIIEGKRRYKMYRQFKMYNDPELNPVLYGQKNR